MQNDSFLCGETEFCISETVQNIFCITSHQIGHVCIVEVFLDGLLRVDNWLIYIEQINSYVIFCACHFNYIYCMHIYDFRNL